MVGDVAPIGGFRVFETPWNTPAVGAAALYQKTLSAKNAIFAELKRRGW